MKTKIEISRTTILRHFVPLLLAIIAVLTAFTVRAQSNYTGGYYFTTFAGLAQGADGTGRLALLQNPYSTAIDSTGNVYVADTYDQTVRKITPAGVVTTLAGFAGAGAVGDVDATGVDARLYYPAGIAVDSAGNVYVTELYANTIRKITPAGVVTTLAGTFGVTGSANGTGSAASFNQPWGIAVDKTGNLYVADYGNHTIRKITPAGVVSKIAGAVGVTGSADGSGTAARFYYPAGVAIDSAGNLYVADSANYTIRKIALSPSVSVSTFAGTAGNYGSADGTGAAASFSTLYGVTVDGAGNVYVADTNNGTIRKITSTRVVSTFAGTAGGYGSADGTGAAAQFASPWGVTVNSAGTLLYVADYGNNEVRKITSTRVVSTFAGSINNPPGGPGYVDATGRAARFNYAYGVALVGTTLYVADTNNYAIRKITSTGVVTTLAGGTYGTADGTGTAAQFASPYAIAGDKNGNLYVADYGSSTIRKIVASSGVVTTLAGNGVAGYADGTGTSAQFANPLGIAVDSAGTTVYVADTYNFVIRKINVSTRAVSTWAGYQPDGGVGDVDGTGSNARLYYPTGIAVDKNNNAYVTEQYGNTIRKITSTAVVSTLAGTFGVTGSADGTGSAASFNYPYGIAVDGTGKLYVTDYSNFTIRKIASTGIVTTAGGVPAFNGMHDATGIHARFYYPTGIASDATGKVYITDTYNNEIRTGVLADLKITCTDGKTGIASGAIDTYTITVTNTGLEDVVGSVVTDTFPTQVQQVSYTATGKNGASGFANGAGNINQTVNLPPNSSITYKAMCIINGTSGTVVADTAQVSVPAGVTDPNAANNKATDKTTIQ
jgi:uncharacterized repeat protein (TIGR01451 family)